MFHDTHTLARRAALVGTLALACAGSVLLAAALGLVVTTAAQAAAPRAHSSQAAKASAVKKGTTNVNGFTLSHGTSTLRAILVDAPPVYDPGGPVCFVEDWTGDAILLANAEREAAAHGAVVVRVICAHDDTARAKTLARQGYTVASEWYTAPLPLAKTAPPAHIRRLTAADVPRVLELGEQKRREYEAYSPVFWHMSRTPRETFTPYMKSQVEDAQNIALAHEQDSKVDGFVLVNGRGTIDDYTVAAPKLWPTVGAELLDAAGKEAQMHGLKSLLVICGAGDIPKRTMLAAQGLTPATDWYVKPVSKEK